VYIGASALLIADTGNNRVRSVGLDFSGQVSGSTTIRTKAGSGNCCSTQDGTPALNANFAYPTAVSTCFGGLICIADPNNNIVWIDDGGSIFRLAGGGGSGSCNGLAGDGGYAP